MEHTEEISEELQAGEATPLSMPSGEWLKNSDLRQISVRDESFKQGKNIFLKLLIKKEKKKKLMKIKTIY